jgi:hypothetical protein
MTKEQQLELSIGIELDFYINLNLENGITDKVTRTFISHVVIPRLMKMKAILGGYTESKHTFVQRRKLEEEFMKVQFLQG